MRDQRDGRVQIGLPGLLIQAIDRPANLAPAQANENRLFMMTKQFCHKVDFMLLLAFKST